MTPEKALELVGRYARLTKQIKDCKKRIGDSLELCQGINGSRLPRQTPYGLLREDHPEHFDRKNRDMRMHIWNWYQPEIGECGSTVWESIDKHEHGSECPHCYAAHLAIQERKAARIQLGHVRAAMSKGGAQ
jgi:hypothetical protein